MLLASNINGVVLQSDGHGDVKYRLCCYSNVPVVWPVSCGAESRIPRGRCSEDYYDKKMNTVTPQ
jgi:hypothetical protein